MTKPPEDVRLLGRVVRIRSADLDVDGECTDGTVYYNSEDENPDNVRDTVVHELIHHYETMLGLRFKEQQVRQLAVCVLQMIRDNPKLIAWLQATN